jgi:phosphohistidine swiveling domain-containing protein
MSSILKIIFITTVVVLVHSYSLPAFAIPPTIMMALPPGIALLKPLLLLACLLIIFLRSIYSKFHIFFINHRKAPRIILEVIVIIILGVIAVTSKQPELLNTIEIQDLKPTMSSGSKPFIVDLRLPSEMQYLYLFNSINGYYLGRDTENLIYKQLNEHPDEDVYIMCDLGLRSVGFLRLFYKHHPDAPRNIKLIKYGSVSFGTVLSDSIYKVIRVIPRDIANNNISLGNATRFNISSIMEPYSRNLLIFKRALKYADKPAFIFFDNKDISPNQIESSLGNESMPVHYYVLPKSADMNISSTSGFITMFYTISAKWRQLTGSVLSLYLLIFIIAFIVLYILRKREIILSLNKKGKFLFVPQLLIILFSTLLINLLAKGDYVFMAWRPMWTPNLFFNHPFMFYFFMIIITIAIWLNGLLTPNKRKDNVLKSLRSSFVSKSINYHDLFSSWNLYFIWLISIVYCAFSLTLYGYAIIPFVAFTSFCILKHGESFLCNRYLFSKPAKWSSASFLGLLPLFVKFPSVSGVAYIFIIALLFSCIFIDLVLVLRLRNKYSSLKSQRSLFRYFKIFFSISDRSYTLLTRVDEYPGRYLLSYDNFSLSIGMFSGSIHHSNEDISNPDLEHIPLDRILDIGRVVHRIIGYDCRLHFDSNGSLIDIEVPDATYSISSSIHERLAQIISEDISPDIGSIRYDGSIYEDVAPFPTPLTLSILKNRWTDNGAAIKGLRSLGLLTQKGIEPGRHLVNIGSRLYKDTVYESTLLKTSRLGNRINSLILNISSDIVMTTASSEYYSVIISRDERICEQYRTLSTLNIPTKKLHRIVIDALRLLFEDTAFFQEKISTVHYYLFHRLSTELNKLGICMSSLPVNRNSANDPHLHLNSSYELYDAAIDSNTNSGNILIPNNILILHRKWIESESLKQKARTLYLQQLSTVSQLLSKLGEVWDIGDDINFLEYNELRNIFNIKDDDLAELIEERKSRWNDGKKLDLPLTLSLSDTENIAVHNSILNIPIDVSKRSKGTLVSGTHKTVGGNIRVVNSVKELTFPKQTDIVVTKSISPNGMLALSNVAGVITERGNILCHSAILAREMAITAVMGYTNATSIFENGEYVQLMPDGKILQIIDRGRLWLSLKHLSHMHSYGNKIKNLSIMLEHGVPVPRGASLSHEALLEACKYWNCDLPSSTSNPVSPIPNGLLRRDLPPGLTDDLLKLLEFINPRSQLIIVRSSADVEDSQNKSYAGLFKSLKSNVSITDLVDTICKCWESLWLIEPSSYQSERSDNAIELNLLIQEYLSCDYGGVLFTKHPLNKDSDQYLIEMSINGAEGVVNGEGTILQMTTTSKGNVVKDLTEKPPFLLDDKSIKQLCEYASIIKTIFNDDQDIEWISSNGIIYILQARNITT